MNKGLFTIKELSAYLSMGESTINRDVREQRFPPPVWVGSNKYWRKTDIDNWIANLSTGKITERKETRGRKRLAV